MADSTDNKELAKQYAKSGNAVLVRRHQGHVCNLKGCQSGEA